MSFSADKVNMLKGAFSQRRFSSSKDPSESGKFYNCFFLTEDLLRHAGNASIPLSALSTILKLVIASTSYMVSRYHPPCKAFGLPKPWSIEELVLDHLLARITFPGNSYPSISAVSLERSNPSPPVCHAHILDLHLSGTITAFIR